MLMNCFPLPRKQSRTMGGDGHSTQGDAACVVAMVALSDEDGRARRRPPAAAGEPPGWSAYPVGEGRIYELEGGERSGGTDLGSGS